MTAERRNRRSLVPPLLAVTPIHGLGAAIHQCDEAMPELNPVAFGKTTVEHVEGMVERLESGDHGGNALYAPDRHTPSALPIGGIPSDLWFGPSPRDAFSPPSSHFKLPPLC
jgi:hypothetical protein